MNHTEKLLEYFKENKEAFLEILKKAVEYESPTYGRRELKDRCADYLYGLFQSLGFEMEKIYKERVGYHIHGTYGKAVEKPIFLLGHYDTVFEEHTIKSMPYYVEDDKAHGPGIFDMKGGVIGFYMAMKAIQDLKIPLKNPVELFINADEEAGSVTSREMIESIARHSKACIVTEPGFTERGSIKNERYGRAVYKITADGVTGHAGNHPENASNPITELAIQWEKLEKMNRYEEGLTISAVSIHSGTPKPTAKIPGSAYMYLDIRFRKEEQFLCIKKVLKELQPVLTPMKIKAEGGIEKEPLLPDEKNTKLVKLASEIWKKIGVELLPRPVGGGSDGNFTSAAGCPTIDGVGLSGEFLHNPREYVRISDIPYRLALIAELILNI